MVFSPFVCAHEVECHKVSKSIFFFEKKKIQTHQELMVAEMEPSHNSHTQLTVALMGMFPVTEEDI